MISTLFWNITQRRVVVPYRRFGRTYRSHLKGFFSSSHLKMGPLRCPETSVKDYHSTLHNIPEERIYHVYRGASLKSRDTQISMVTGIGVGRHRIVGRVRVRVGNLSVPQNVRPIVGRAMAQAVSRRPPTAEARVRSRVSPYGICGGQSGIGTGFSPSSSVFPCQFHSTGAPLLGKGQKIIIIVIIGLHNKPHGCSASVVSAAGPFAAKEKKTKCGPHPSSIQWLPGAVFAGVKRPHREATHCPQLSAEVKDS
jgi:hypothetical protein